MENWDDFKSKNPGKYFYFTRYGKKPHTEFNFKPEGDEEIYLIFGKESTGIPKEILRGNIDSCMRIPMSGNVRSLNLSNCAMMILYEALRQQDFPNLSKVEVQKGEDFIYE